MRVSVFAALLLAASSASARARPDLPVANKLFVLVGASGCELARLTPQIGIAAERLVRDRRTSRVVIDWPADPGRKLDMMGRPSPILAGLEVSAAARTLPGLANEIHRRLTAICPTDVYLVQERPLMRPVRDWPIGQQSPGGKIVNTVVRKPGVSTEDFIREWTEIHAPLSLAWRSAAALPAGRYVQNVVIAQPGSTAPMIDGIGEIETSVLATDAIRAGRMKTAQHAQLFSDPAKAAMFTVREVILKDR